MRSRGARRPKVAKLAESERLRTWVQDRLAGEVRLPDGTTVGPKPKAWNGKNDLAFDFDDALLQSADPGLELLDELTEHAIVGLKMELRWSEVPISHTISTGDS